ncbi:MAG: hypothetical protein AB7N65_27250 [Vicinamibacterales bacterium]
MTAKLHGDQAGALWTRTAAVLLTACAFTACGVPSDDEVFTADRISAQPERAVDGPVRHDLLTSGRRVDVAVPVEGDVAAAGAEVRVSAPVEGYVMSAGRTVSVAAPVGNDLWAAGERVTLTSRVGNNAMIAGQRVHLMPGSVVGHDARLAGSDVRSEADVERNLRIGAEKAEIGGEVGGTVRANADHVTLLPDAIVRGDLVVRASAPPTISPGAQVMGTVHYRSSGRDRSWFAWPLRWAGLFLSLLVLGLGALAAAPAWSGRVADTLRSRTIWSVLSGPVVLIAMPLAMGVLFLTIVGIPLAVVLAAIYVGALVLAVAFVSYGLGLGFFERAHRAGASRWMAVTVGALVVSLVVSLPVVGWVMALVVASTGAGAVVVEWGHRRRRPNGGTHAGGTA